MNSKTPQQWADQWTECIQYGEFGASFNSKKAELLFKVAMSQAWNEGSKSSFLQFKKKMNISSDASYLVDGLQNPYEEGLTCWIK